MHYENSENNSSADHTKRVALLFLGNVEGVSEWVAVRRVGKVSESKQWVFQWKGRAEDYLKQFHN